MVRHDTFRWIRMAAAAAAVTVLNVLPVQAQYFCDRHDKMVAQLAEIFNEKRIGYGLAGRTMVAEIFVSPSGSWTLLMTDVSGRSYIVAAGDGWETQVVTFGEGV